MGEGDCGEAQTWNLTAGEEKRCCTSLWMNDVDKFEYKATPVVSGSWGPGSITFSVEEYSHSVFVDLANPEKVPEAKCQLDGSAQTCTGQACVSPGSSGNCSAVVGSPLASAAVSAAIQPSSGAASSGAAASSAASENER